MNAPLATVALLEEWPLWIQDKVIAPLPSLLQPVATGVLAIVGVLAAFGLGFAFTTLVERKLIGRFQNRPGPNRTGPFGLLQPFADAVKALTKEDTVPASADRVLHFLAPAVVVACALIGYAVLPFGQHLVAVRLDAGLLFFFAAGATTELAIFMAGWSSRNKYSLLAAMRALAQLISYELPLLLSTIPVVLAVGSLSLPEIVDAQAGWTGGVLPHWHVFTPWGLVGFGVFLVAALAESNRCPFDLPEAESELIAGHLTEYSGFKYALFFMGEYFGLFGLSGLGITLFLGGWHAPCAFLTFIPSYLWFGLKLAAMIFLFIWIRATLLRLRIDQLTRLAWKFLVPIALTNLAAAAFWVLTRDWSSAAAVGGRWAITLVVALAPYVLLGRRMLKGRGTRTYRYAP